MDSFQVIPGNYTTEQEVQVEFTKIVEVPETQKYSEQDVLNTIAFIEQQKIDYCALKDAEIAINQAMLAKIRLIDRTGYLNN